MHLPNERCRLITPFGWFRTILGFPSLAHDALGLGNIYRFYLEEFSFKCAGTLLPRPLCETLFIGIQIETV